MCDTFFKIRLYGHDLNELEVLQKNGFPTIQLCQLKELRRGSRIWEGATDWVLNKPFDVRMATKEQFD